MTEYREVWDDCEHCDGKGEWTMQSKNSQRTTTVTCHVCEGEGIVMRLAPVTRPKRTIPAQGG